MSDDEPPRLLTPAQKRFLERVERIHANQPTMEDIAFMARELVQVTLPHCNPGDVPEWARRNGSLTLSIRPGWHTDAKTGERRSIGYPYGSIPRLLLFWLTAEAVQKKSRHIELGRSLSDFMFQLGLDPGTGRGPRGDARRLRDQMDRLFRASISFDRTTTEGRRAGNSWLNMAVTTGGEVWWSPRDPAQAALWGSWIELGETFFKAITAAPVPLDMRALKALKRSPLALDLYAWLTYEAYRAHKSGKGRFVSWERLAEQMGGDYARTTDFQQKAVAALRKIATLYPTLKLGPMRGGIRIEPESLPAITPRPAATVEQTERVIEAERADRLAALQAKVASLKDRMTRPEHREELARPQAERPSVYDEAEPEDVDRRIASMAELADLASLDSTVLAGDEAAVKVAFSRMLQELIEKLPAIERLMPAEFAPDMRKVREQMAETLKILGEKLRD